MNDNTNGNIFLSILLIVLLSLRSTMLFAGHKNDVSRVALLTRDSVEAEGALADTSSVFSLASVSSDSLSVTYHSTADTLPNTQYTIMRDSASHRESDMERMKRRYTHFISLEGSYGRVAVGYSDFLKGDNLKGTPIKQQASMSFKYAFQPRRGTVYDLLYGSPYQGLGFFTSTYYHGRDIGTPWGIYLFQGARVAQITPKLSFNYEWNFGFSGGWHHYSYPENKINTVIGSPFNAYINASFYFNYIISRHFDFKIGISANHFSNGNTKLPNDGINALSGVFGIKYYFNRDFDKNYSTRNIVRPPFRRAMLYELLAYASWKDAAFENSDGMMPSPYLNKKLLVGGFSFSPMYVLSRKIRLGASLDFSFDNSRGMSYEYTVNGIKCTKGSVRDRIAVGTAAKVDFVMPFFIISSSLGYDIIKGGGSLPPFYQILALRFDLTPHVFLNIGYKARNFQYPDNLMLGMGFRFGRGTRYQL